MTNNKMYATLSKRITLCLLVLYFALCPLLFVRVNSVHALSEPNSNIPQSTIYMSPYRTMELSSYGVRNNPGRFFFGNINRQWLDSASYGNAPYIGLPFGERQNSLTSYVNDYYGPNLKGGVYTVLDGVTNSLNNTQKNNYYDNSNDYVLQQTFNDEVLMPKSTSGTFQITAWNTSNIKFGFNKPTVLYLNSLVTNLDIKLRGGNSYTLLNIPNGTPVQGLSNFDWEYLEGFDYGPIDRQVNYLTYCEDNDLNNELWDSFRQFLQQYMVGVTYLKVNVHCTFASGYRESEGDLPTHIFDETYLVYGDGTVLRSDNRTIVNHYGTIPLTQHLLNENILQYAFINDYSVFFSDFTVDITAMSNNNTRSTVDDFQIDYSGITINLPAYDTVNSSISANDIDFAERNSFAHFLNEAPFNDNAIISKFFDGFFDISIVPGLKLADFLLVALGGILIVLFIRFFR